MTYRTVDRPTREISSRIKNKHLTVKGALGQWDFYKTDHANQYKEGLTTLYSNMTARSGTHSNVPNSKGIILAGVSGFCQEYLIDCFDETFFNAPKEEAVKYYETLVRVGSDPMFSADHVRDLHDLGYLPLEIKSLPEGSFVPYRVPSVTIQNTHPDFGWLVNTIETVMSCEISSPICASTVYHAYRRIFKSYAELTCENDDHVPFQGHDFSFRGMGSRTEAAACSFATLATGSMGTDTLPALYYACDYYGADPDEFFAGSIPATEHSVMCSGGDSDEDQISHLERLLTEVYPNGNFAAVLDTWDFWKVVTLFLPVLKDEIMGRNGKFICRPDSGNPVHMICGNSDANTAWERAGLIETLWGIFGGTINSKGYKVLDSHIGAIYGDAITLERADDILRLLTKKGYASSNVVLGIGSFTYKYVTRDTHGMAVKATHATIAGESVNLFKDPKTDDGTKKSAKGLMMVTETGGIYSVKQECTPKEEARGCLKTIFINSEIIDPPNLKDIRATADSYLHYFTPLPFNL